MWRCAWPRWRQNLPPIYHLPRRMAACLIWLAILYSSIVLPLAAQTPDQTLTLPEYRAELSAAIDELEATPADQILPTIERIQQQLATITHVTYASGEVVTLDPLLEDLELDAKAQLEAQDGEAANGLRTVTLARLRATIAQIDAAPRDNTAARLALLDEILARPEFNRPLSLWERFWQWFERVLAEWLPDRPAAGNAGWLALLLRALPWIITTIIVAVVIWLLSYWLQRVLGSFVADARATGNNGDDQLPATAAEARQQARAAAEAGHYRDAVRRLYLAALLQLSEHGLITYERSLTNREVLVRVPDNSPVRRHLEPVVATFDQVWYGVREPDQTTFTAYEREIDTLSAVAAASAADRSKQDNA